MAMALSSFSIDRACGARPSADGSDGSENAGNWRNLTVFSMAKTCEHFVHAGTAPAGIRYVITLDADTQLPHGSARRLIETIAHPLNKVELTQDQRNRVRGYTIIQPRVSITLPSATASRFYEAIHGCARERSLLPGGF